MAPPTPPPWAIVLDPTEDGYEALIKAEPCATAIGWEGAPTAPPLVRWRELRDPEVWSPVSLRLWEDGRMIEAGEARVRAVIARRLGPWLDGYYSRSGIVGLDLALALSARIVELGLARMVLLDLVDGEVRERNP